jgi:hypothetical protein
MNSWLTDRAQLHMATRPAAITQRAITDPTPNGYLQTPLRTRIVANPQRKKKEPKKKERGGPWKLPSLRKS